MALQVLPVTWAASPPPSAGFALALLLRCNPSRPGANPQRKRGEGGDRL